MIIKEPMKTIYRVQLLEKLNALIDQLNDAEIDQLITMLTPLIPTPHKVNDKTYLMENTALLWLRENKDMIERCLGTHPTDILTNIDKNTNDDVLRTE
ncbi:MAG: hypothetical protein WCX80_04575 [Patescibacteria group bacterium]